MRFIFGIALVLLGIGVWCCQIGGPAETAAAAAQQPWVRTVDGWERAGSWLQTPAHIPRLHPLVVGAGQLLASLLALTIASLQATERSRPARVVRALATSS